MKVRKLRVILLFAAFLLSIASIFSSFRPQGLITASLRFAERKVLVKKTVKPQTNRKPESTGRPDFIADHSEQAPDSHAEILDFLNSNEIGDVDLTLVPTPTREPEASSFVWGDGELVHVADGIWEERDTKVALQF